MLKTRHMATSADPITPCDPPRERFESNSIATTAFNQLFSLGIIQLLDYSCWAVQDILQWAPAANLSLRGFLYGHGGRHRRAAVPQQELAGLADLTRFAFGWLVTVKLGRRRCGAA